MSDTRALRDHLVRVLDWEDAHVGFDKAIDGIPAGNRRSRAGLRAFPLAAARAPPARPGRHPRFLPQQRLQAHDDVAGGLLAERSCPAEREGLGRQHRLVCPNTRRLEAARARSGGLDGEGSHRQRQPDISARDPARRRSRGVPRRADRGDNERRWAFGQPTNHPDCEGNS